jgi:hypothetical protein
MQIIAEGGVYNGQSVAGFAIDPTPLVERDNEPIHRLDDDAEDNDGLWQYFLEQLRRLGLI